MVEPNAEQWLIIRTALIQTFPELEPVWVNHLTQATAFLTACLAGKRKLPRLILLELLFPDREGGLAVVERLKATLLFQLIPVIILSHSRDEEDITAAYNVGIGSYIVKPDHPNKWLTFFYIFRRYWWEVATLPINR